MTDQTHAGAAADAAGERPSRKEREGVVVSDVQDKTIVVTAEQHSVHPLYDKRIMRSRKFHVHDEHDEASVGDLVRIIETRPLSKKKRWRLAEIVEQAK